MCNSRVPNGQSSSTATIPAAYMSRAGLAVPLTPSGGLYNSVPTGGLEDDSDPSHEISPLVLVASAVTSPKSPIRTFSDIGSALPRSSQSSQRDKSTDPSGSKRELQLGARKMLPGFRSRCTIWFWWRYAMPSRIARRMRMEGFRWKQWTRGGAFADDDDDDDDDDVDADVSEERKSVRVIG